ncbi:hypothetical protein JMUB7507_26560 [Staphylococcus aureus]
MVRKWGSVKKSFKRGVYIQKITREVRNKGGRYEARRGSGI